MTYLHAEDGTLTTRAKHGHHKGHETHEVKGRKTHAPFTSSSSGHTIESIALSGEATTSAMGSGMGVAGKAAGQASLIHFCSRGLGD